MTFSHSFDKDSLKKQGKKILNETVTFFGVPANTILIVLGILLLVLTITPAITVLLDTFKVHIMEYVPGKKTGDFTFYWYHEVFAGANSWKNFYLPLLNSLGISVLACLFAIVFGGTVAY